MFTLHLVYSDHLSVRTSTPQNGVSAQNYFLNDCLESISLRKFMMTMIPLPHQMQNRQESQHCLPETDSQLNIEFLSFSKRP